MIALKSQREIHLIQKGAEILKQVFREVKSAVRPGIRTEELDVIAERVIRQSGGKPAFKGYRGFPKTACISVNEEVVHGIPGPRVLEKGDIVSFDIGVLLEGFYSDAARTWPVGEISETKSRLIETAKKALEIGLDEYQPGWRIGDLSACIQQFIEAQGFQVVRDYVGHGIGRNIHEDPQVPNYGSPGRGPKIEEGLVIAIEPMVTEGHFAVETLEDGWTVVTRDRKLSSHYEDTVAFMEGRVVSLTGDSNGSGV